MAQERKGEYNVALTSISEDKFRQGITPPGRYKGFDTITDAGGTGVNININHSATGFNRNTFDATPVAESNLYAYLITPQGVAVETDIIVTNLALSSLPSLSGQKRVDAVVFDHTYTTVQGGAQGNVIIVTGTASNGNGMTNEYPPAPGINSSKQTLLGYIFIEGDNSGSFTFSNITYVRMYACTPVSILRVHVEGAGRTALTTF